VTRAILRLAAVAATVVALDQWTKHWATRTLAFRPPLEVVGEFVRLTYTRNSGVAFGLGAGLPFPYYVFSIAAVVVILYLFARQRVTGWPRQLALALILGGAVGNLIDRVRFGEVVDFIEIGYGRWRWPVFNVADSAVTVGVGLFALTWPRRHPADEPALHGATHEPDAEPVGSRAERGGAARPLPGGGPDGPLA
jgi:signal peptidase II